MAGVIQASEGYHGLGTSMLVPQNTQGEEDGGPGRKCNGLEDAQDLEMAVPPPLLPMAPCGSQVCLCSEGKDTCFLKLDLSPSPFLTPNEITCILAF